MEFRDLNVQYKKYKFEIDSAIQQVLDKGDFISGEKVTILEKKLETYIGVKHCITCANGTDALSLVLMAWDIKAGDAVFVPNFTFFSSGEVVSFEGATPIFVDIEERTFNMNPVELEKAIISVIKEGNLKPKVIIPVDLFGLPANYMEIEEIAKKYNLRVLEDGAQGFGGSINGKKACSFGDAAITSFFPAKPLGCYGDGGAVFTNDDYLAKLIESLKIHGRGQDKYDNIRIGMNSRLDTIQAAILDVKLNAFISHELNDVNQVAKMYNELIPNRIKKPFIPNGYVSSYAQYTIILNNEIERDYLSEKFKKANIPVMVYYAKTMNKQHAFKELPSFHKKYEVSDKICKCVLSLPMHPYLNESEIKLVAKILEEI